MIAMNKLKRDMQKYFQDIIMILFSLDVLHYKIL